MIPCVLVLLLMLISPVLGAEYPTSTITIIMPMPAGGAADLQTRIAAIRMAVKLGEPVVVLNVPGAGGTIGTTRVVRSLPDGYTLLANNLQAHNASKLAYEITYDPEIDFVPVATLGENRMLLVARPNLQTANLRPGDFLAWLREQPRTVAVTGFNTPSYLAAVDFAAKHSVAFRLIPYRGAPTALMDVGEGRVDLMFDQEPSAGPWVQDGRLHSFQIDQPFVAQTVLFARRETPSFVLDRLRRAVGE